MFSQFLALWPFKAATTQLSFFDALYMNKKGTPYVVVSLYMYVVLFFLGGQRQSNIQADFINDMSTGKRLPKRSIIGTRVVAPGENNRLFPGVIVAMKTLGEEVVPDGTRDSETRYSVRFDYDRKVVKEFVESEIIGPGFSNVTSSKLKPDQTVYVTHANREFQGIVRHHRPNIDQVIIQLVSAACQFPEKSNQTK